MPSEAPALVDAPAPAGTAAAFVTPTVSPPHDWPVLLGALRDGLARVVGAPVIRADPAARAAVTELIDEPDPEALDRALDDLSARLDALLAERMPAEVGRSPPAVSPRPPAAPPVPRVDAGVRSGWRKLLRL